MQYAMCDGLWAFTNKQWRAYLKLRIKSANTYPQDTGARLVADWDEVPKLYDIDADRAREMLRKGTVT